MGDIYKWTFDSDATQLADKLERYVFEKWNSYSHTSILVKPSLSEFTKERLKASISKAAYKPSLSKALISCFGREYLMYGIILILEEWVVKWAYKY